MLVSIHERVTISAQVIFGSPGRNCSGNGICRMLPHHVKIPDTWSCPVFLIDLDWISPQKLILYLNHKQLQATGIQNQLQERAGFLLEEDFQLPLWLNRHGGGKQWYIPAAKYSFRVVNELGGIAIHFPLLNEQVMNWGTDLREISGGKN